MSSVKNIINGIWKKLSKGILQMFGANVLNKVVSMLGNMVITRMLTKTEYGIWSCVLNTYSYLNLISGLGLLSGAFQFGAENRGKEEEFQYYKFCLKIGLIIDTILVIGFFIATFVIDFSMSEANPYLRTIAPMILFDYVFQILLTILRCENRISEYANILNVNTILLTVGTCGGAYFGIEGVIIGKYIAYVVSLIQVIFHTKDEVKRINKTRSIPWKHTVELWHYSIFTGISSALNVMLYLIGVSMIATLISDPVEVAYYKVATLLPNALVFIPNSVITCILPNIVANNKNYPWLKKNIGISFVGLGALNVIICGVGILFAPIIITILSGEQYLSAVPAFRVLMFSYFVSGTFRSLSINILAALRCVNYGLLISVISLICNIVFNYLFVEQYGTIGAAYATLGVVVVTAVLSFVYLIYKLQKEKNAYGN